jgi:hypothetical protein
MYVTPIYDLFGLLRLVYLQFQIFRFALQPTVYLSVPFMEPKYSFPWPQEVSPESYPEPYKSTVQQRIMFLHLIPSLII